MIESAKKGLVRPKTTVRSYFDSKNEISCDISYNNNNPFGEGGALPLPCIGRDFQMRFQLRTKTIEPMIYVCDIN